MSSSASKFRHDFRGGVNALKLSLSALEIETDPELVAEWLDAMSRAADKCIRALEEYEVLEEEAQAAARQ